MLVCKTLRLFFIVGVLLIGARSLEAQTITAAGKPARLEVRAAGSNSVRITLKPLDFKEAFPYTPALNEDYKYAAPVISITSLNGAVKKKAGNLQVEVKPSPLSIIVRNAKEQVLQQLSLNDNGEMSFKLDDRPVLGMGEGGPQPERGANWRELPIEFDRRGRFHRMVPRWQGGVYGTRNPVAMLIGTQGWGLFVVTPWVRVDMRDKDHGTFIPWDPNEKTDTTNERPAYGTSFEDRDKGIQPMENIVPGLYDVFVFDTHNPVVFMKELSLITGPAVLPPKWAMGYMQSHRTLQDDTQMLGIVDSFRAKKIPLDAVIYLGTGFTPRGWNKRQPSFEFNPEVYKHDPVSVLSDMHKRNVKVVVHMVPLHRDKLPTLQGNIPARPGEPIDASHLTNYWAPHAPLMKAGIDGFWPDEGDWFNLFERIKRHQVYYQGPLSTLPNVRPWSLHRNDHLGIAQWGGWVWSGDPLSSWRTLEGQVAVGINHSLSVSPFWGSDIGGFGSNEELTGELYARWFQFGAFCSSFRAHGKTWWTRLPWGWGLDSLGPIEDRRYPLVSELKNPKIEPVAKKYAELRYQLLPYNYTLAWEARNSGLPMMRALWLHYPTDEKVQGMGSEYLWGRDLLIAPVFEKGATSRTVYLPAGDWYDWWTGEKHSGGQSVTRSVDLSIMPIYARAGAIIPVDPIRQYTSQPITEPTTLRVYSGANGDFTLYDDDGISQDYLKGKSTRIRISYNNSNKKLTIEPATGNQGAVQKEFNIVLYPSGSQQKVNYKGSRIEVQLK